MKEEIAKELLKFIAETNTTSSSFLSPELTSNVNTIKLLDKIAELRGIPKEENGREFNEIADQLKDDNKI